MKLKNYMMDRDDDPSDYPTQAEKSDAEVDAQIDARQQAEIEAPKLCVDCKHYVADSMGVQYDKCHHPKSAKSDENNFIRESMPLKYYFCSSMRLGLGCEGAKLWEAK